MEETKKSRFFLILKELCLETESLDYSTLELFANDRFLPHIHSVSRLLLPAGMRCVIDFWISDHIPGSPPGLAMGVERSK